MSCHRVILTVILTLWVIPAQAGVTFGGTGIMALAMETGATGACCCQNDASDGTAEHGSCAMPLCQASVVTATVVARRVAPPQQPLAPNAAPYHGPRSGPDTPPPQAALPI